jgi:hypothetical protein
MNQDLPMSPKKTRKAALMGQLRQAPRVQSAAAANVRKHLAKAYLKPSLNIDADTVSFLWVDSNGGIVNPTFVTLKPGLTIPIAKARAIRHWDAKEAHRIGSWNMTMCVYWARNRIARKVLLEAGLAEEAAEIPHEEDVNKLQQLHTCTGALERTRLVLDAMSEDVNRGEKAAWWFY